MYEEITKQEFINKVEALIRETSDNLLYAIDIIVPLLENKKYVSALPFLNGCGSINDTVDALYNNIDILEKDKLFKEDGTIVYFINEFNMPSRMTREDYAIMISNELNFDIDGEPIIEAEYKEVKENPDNEKMFG